MNRRTFLSTLAGGLLETCPGGRILGGNGSSVRLRCGKGLLVGLT